MFDINFSFGVGPTEPTTPSQLQVIVLVLVFVLVAFGFVLLYLSFGQPPEKHELAMRARRMGLSSLGGAAFISAIAYAIKRICGA